ncbi:hypothetical protein O6H91_01G081900 [Diphasiastrum complanatum]|uniref:Uncharacterized protein n=1 Tax=Diphasiastrum complanatum TaxID=34168 RepID=A0ACC2ET19_DIPCM|nr:hypothetical protein O6H91_01G081900 [Diphasiastrum complanatum]
MGIRMSTGASKFGASEKLTERFLRKSRKREALALEATDDELLAQNPDRICSNGSNTMASLYTKQGRKGVNQDAMILWEGFCSMEETVFCGVFDGHGPNGHLVARRVRDSLPSRLACELQELFSSYCAEAKPMTISNDSIISLEISETNGRKEPEMFTLWRDSFLKACIVMEKELRVHPSIDCSYSGTTAVTIFKQGRHLVIGNVGDSRAILGTKAENGTLVAVQLTVDLKPNLPQEAERIKQCKGRVLAMRDEPNVHRMWMPDNNSPGLAMARAFGDLCFKEFGLIAVPDIFYRFLTYTDQFIVLATDGVSVGLRSFSFNCYCKHMYFFE